MWQKLIKQHAESQVKEVVLHSFPFYNELIPQQIVAENSPSPDPIVS